MKTKCKPTQKKEYRVRFETADGSLIVNRLADPLYWEVTWPSDIKRRDQMLQREAQEKGVKILNATFDKNGVFVIVDWLRAK